MICNYFPVHTAYLPTSELQPASRANYLLYESTPTSHPPHPVAGTLQPTPDESLQKPKQKRTRTAFTGFQLIELEREFKRNMYMFRHHRIHVAQRLALRESQVKVWFQNRRMRHKKETKGLQEKKPNSKSLMSHSEPNAHQEIVQRLMSYSQDPSSQHPKITINHNDKKKTIRSIIQPQKQQSLSVTNNTTSGNEFSEIISFLEGSSAQQTSYIAPSHTPYPNDLDMVLQSINNDLEVQPLELRQQQHPTSMYFPGVNL